MKKKIYNAGKITGDKGYREKFAAVEAALWAQGFTVINPAVLPEGMRPADYMRICFAMVDIADEVIFLPDWQESQGANLEMALCQYIKKPIAFLPKGFLPKG